MEKASLFIGEVRREAGEISHKEEEARMWRSTRITGCGGKLMLLLLSARPASVCQSVSRQLDHESSVVVAAAAVAAVAVAAAAVAAVAVAAVAVAAVAVAVVAVAAVAMAVVVVAAVAVAMAAVAVAAVALLESPSIAKKSCCSDNTQKS